MSFNANHFNWLFSLPCAFSHPWKRWVKISNVILLCQDQRNSSNTKKIRQQLCLRWGGNDQQWGGSLPLSRKKKKDKPKSLLTLCFNLRLGLAYVNSNWKLLGEKHRIILLLIKCFLFFVFPSRNRYWDSRATWQLLALFITTESKDALTDLFRLNYQLPQSTVSQWTTLNIFVRETHTAAGLSVPIQMTKMISDFRAITFHQHVSNSLIRKQKYYVPVGLFLPSNFCSISETGQGWNFSLTEMSPHNRILYP